MKSKWKKIIPILLVLSLLFNVVFLYKFKELYWQYWQHGIIGLHHSALYMTTIMPRMEDPEDWDNAAFCLGEMLQNVRVKDRADNFTVERLIFAVSQVNGSQDRIQLCEQLRELTFGWDTGEWTCTMIRGNIDELMQLCGYE